MPKRSIYLDFAAATPMSNLVLKAMQPYFSDLFYNPSANYQASQETKGIVQSAREQVAAVLGAKSSEVIFTAGGTEANNLAIHGVMKNYPKANLVISAIEHPSVTAPSKDYKAKLCPLDSWGIVNTDKLRDLIDDQTVLVSVMYVNNEIGTIEPIADISRLIKDIRTSRLERGINLPIYFHTDACQAANYLDLHVSRLGVDLMTINGGKIYGPKQSGVLFVSSSVKLKPLIDGGGQERGLRSGTENVASIVGFSKALSLAQESRRENSDKTNLLQHYFLDELTKMFPEAKVNGPINKRIVNNIHVTFPGVDNEWLLIKLDDNAIMAAAGSACSAASIEPSSVLKAIGLTDQDARSSIRFSLGNTTTKSDLNYTLSVLKKLLV